MKQENLKDEQEPEIRKLYLPVWAQPRHPLQLQPKTLTPLVLALTR